MPIPAVAKPPTTLFDSLFDGVLSGNQGATSSLVPDPFIIAINGHAYLHDLEFKPWKRQAMRATTTPTTRTQADTSNEPGEQSLSTESLWRRTQDSWHEGSQQVYLDRKGSTEFGFRSSKGINPWTQWQISLLNDTQQFYSSAQSNLKMVVCGTHFYLIDGIVLKFTTDLSSFTTVTGTPGVTPSSLTTDGHTVYVAYGASGVYSTTEGAATATQYVTSAIASTAIVRFVMGRLMVATNNLIYNVTAGGALPGTPLGTSLYGNLIWTDITAGNGVIFAAGNSGNIGVIYSIQINADGVALSAPILCAQMPTGETVNAIYGYAGSGVAIGTNLGWRFSEQVLANGVAGTVALTVGPLNTTANPVRAFSGYGKFIWGTLENYDSLSTGLFRMDPTQFVSDLAPAWASDLMLTAGVLGPVTALVHFNGTPIFVVQGQGIYKQAATYVPSGTIDSGFITYGIADPKMPVFVDVSMSPMTGGQSIQTFVSLDSGPFTSIGTYNNSRNFVEFNTPQNLSQTIEIREQLNSGSGNTTTPIVTRHTLRAVPAPASPTDWIVVIQLREGVRIKDVEQSLVPSTEYAFLDGLRINKVISTLQVGNVGPMTVTVESLDWIPEQWASLTGELNGVMVVTCRTVV